MAEYTEGIVFMVLKHIPVTLDYIYSFILPSLLYLTEIRLPCIL